MVKRKATDAPSTDPLSATTDPDKKRKTEEAEQQQQVTIDAALLQTRLQLGLGTTSSNKLPRGSLPTVARHLHEFLADRDNETKKQDLLRQIQLMKLDLTRATSKLANTRQQQQQQTPTSTSTATTTTTTNETVLKQLREQVAEHYRVTACVREYESLARLAKQQHPVAQRILQQQLDDCRADYQTAVEERRALETQTHIRRGQFSLVIQSIMDLKQSLTKEKLEVEPGEAMDVVEEPATEKKKKEDGDDDNDSLYGEL